MEVTLTPNLPQAMEAMGAAGQERRGEETHNHNLNTFTH